MRRLARVCAHAVPIVLACAAACGPVTYVGDVRRASELIEDARAADAARLAPYWWTRAVEYLHKAREVAARADFQGAHRFGELAASAASQAAADARIAAKDPSKRPRDLPPDVAPARPTEAPAPAPTRPARPTDAPARTAPARPVKPTEAPVAPARDLPPPARSRVAPAKDPR